MEEKCGIGIGIKSARVIVADVIQERPNRESEDEGWSR